MSYTAPATFGHRREAPGVGDSGGAGEGGGIWGGGGSSGGGSRRGSKNESLHTASSDTDWSESSYGAGAKLVASAIAWVEAEKEGKHAAGGAEGHSDLFGGEKDCSRGAAACDIEGDGGGAGDIGEPAVGRRKALSRLTLLTGVDEGMDCIKEEPEQLDM